MKAHLFLLLLAFAGVRAQSISGIVYDENKLAMPGVSVYLDGTSIGTVTADDGTFELSARSKINTSLVFSFLGYESLYVPNPFEQQRYEVHLKPKPSMLNEVVISNDHFSRKSKLKVFREQFLGRTKAGRECRIANEDDIEFQYDLKTNTLRAFSAKPIKVQNPYLGYIVDFNLVEFYVKFSKRSVSSSDAYSSAYAGTTVFREWPEHDPKFSKRRFQSFEGSQVHFFRNLVEKKWGRDSFVLYKGSLPANPDDYFKIARNNGVYEVEIKSDGALKTTMTLEQPKFYASFNLLFDRSEQSRVTFNVPMLTIDDFGNIDKPLDVMFSGKISEQRVGDMLPMDYSR